MDTPIALLVFNRPDVTARVFAAVAAARPRRLLVVADGPRPDRPGEAERCAATRAIVERVDWACDVETNFSEANLGCRRRISSGLDWVFSRVESAIVLEDDCLPDHTFFRYCEELLDRYADDERVAGISGDDFQPPRPHRDASYYFSRFAHIWGWATWRRSWQHYDVAMSDWPEMRDTVLERIWVGDRRAIRYWRAIFDAVHAGAIDTWDYQWLYSCWRRGAVTALPHGNLVSNVGFGPEATHTTEAGPLAGLPTRPLSFPLRHPVAPDVDGVADAYTQHRILADQRIHARVKHWLYTRLVARRG